MSAKRATSDIPLYAAEVANSIGSKIDGSSFSGLLTRVEIGHIRIGSEGSVASDRLGPAHRLASERSRSARG